jgi:hypothetical protein
VGKIHGAAAALPDEVNASHRTAADGEDLRSEEDVADGGGGRSRRRGRLWGRAGVALDGGGRERGQRRRTAAGLGKALFHFLLFV